MKKILLFIFVTLAVHGHAYSEATMPTKYLSAATIHWQKGLAPREITQSREYLRWVDSFGITEERWAYISLFDNQNKQIILQSCYCGSGGAHTAIFSRIGTQPKLIASFIGGFIIYPTPNKPIKLVIFNKLGLEYLRSEYHFENQVIKQKTSYELPIELTRLNNSGIDFDDYFYFLNTGYHKGKND